MNKAKKDCFIKELNRIYKDVVFGFHEEEDSLQLLYNNEKYEDDDDFFDTVSDIALKYLTPDEQNIFTILYDYFNEIKKTKCHFNIQCDSEFNYELNYVSHINPEEIKGFNLIIDSANIKFEQIKEIYLSIDYDNQFDEHLITEEYKETYDIDQNGVIAA